MPYDIPKRVQTAFNRAASSYDQHNTLQLTVCQTLLDQLPTYRNPFGLVVDLGCGTGDSSRLLLDRINCQQLVAVDIADRLLEKAIDKLSYCGQATVCFGNFNHALFPPNAIDFALANMSLQWSVDFQWTLKRLYSQIKKGGLLAFTLPVAGTFVELKQTYRNLFDTDAKIVACLEDENFFLESYQCRSYVLKFDSAAEALYSIKRVGANGIVKPMQQRGLLGKNRLNQMFQCHRAQTNYCLTYVIGFFIAEK